LSLGFSLKHRQSRLVIFLLEILLEADPLLIVGHDSVWVHADLITFVESTFLAEVFARLANVETVAL
jgi:hypothetical protein